MSKERTHLRVEKEGAYVRMGSILLNAVMDHCRHRGLEISLQRIRVTSLT
jgi:hypothetical protein